VKHGGFWQVDFGGIATINLPKECEFDIDKIFKTLGIHSNEMKE